MKRFDPPPGPRSRVRTRRASGLASVLALTLLAGCKASPPTENAPPPEPPAELDHSPPTPTFTADEAAFAAHLDPLNGLPITEADLLGAPLGYVLEFDPADPVVAGLQAVEVWIEAPPAPPSDAGPSEPRWPLLALTLREPNSRPVLGPLAPASAALAEAAAAFGAHRLWAAGAEPSARARLDEAGISLLGLQDGASGAAARDSLSDTLGTTFLPGWRFDESLPTGSVAASLSLPHAADRATVWQYAAAFGLWNRSYAVGEDLRPVRDTDSGEALAARNLLLLHMDPERGWLGEGPATLLRDGLAVEARWQRSDGRGQIRIQDSAGAPLALAPGNTWIGLIALDAVYSIAP